MIPLTKIHKMITLKASNEKAETFIPCKILFQSEKEG